MIWTWELIIISEVGGKHQLSVFTVLENYDFTGNENLFTWGQDGFFQPRSPYKTIQNTLATAKQFPANTNTVEERFVQASAAYILAWKYKSLVNYTDIQTRGQMPALFSEIWPVSAADHYFYIIFNYHLKQARAPEERSPISMPSPFYGDTLQFYAFFSDWCKGTA